MIMMMIKPLLLGHHRAQRRREHPPSYPIRLLLLVIGVGVGVDLVDGRYSCSRCGSQSFSPPFNFDIKECDASDIDDFQSCEQPNGDPCTCAITAANLEYPFSCTLENIAGVDNCACLYDVPDDDCPPGKCDYTFQCGTTLYICWNLMDPTNLGLINDENEQLTCENEEITNIIHCNDPYDNPFTVGDDDDCNNLCTPNFLATVEADDPNNSNIIGTKTCPNSQVVSRYTKFCAPTSSGGPPPGETFIQCNDETGDETIEECFVPYCEYDGEYTITQYPQLPSTSITCPSDMTVTIPADDPTQCVQTVTHADVTSDTDSCDFGISLSTGLSNGSDYSVGSTTNTYTATTSDGTVVSCFFVITVLDIINPTITCPSDITFMGDDGANSAIVDYTIEVGDNCGGGAPSSNTLPGDVNIFSAASPTGFVTVEQTTGLPSGSAFPVDVTTTNTFVVTDVSGNTNTCSFEVTPTSPPPCPDDVTPCRLLFGQEGTPMIRYVRFFWFWKICVEECVLLDSVVEFNLDLLGYECGYCP